ncbi:MAG: AAA family ATPase [Muribaculaceae bacterium]|nr:AAA family ATPase [Muribaculaceae bacterium]
MYLSNIKLWNFRKFGTVGDIDLLHPNLNLSFTKGLNVLIGENDSGKSAILEAIKMVLKTHAYERLMWVKEDFYEGTTELRIELLIDGLTNSEAAHFTEWLGWTNGDSPRPILRLIYTVRLIDDKPIPHELRAGMDEAGAAIDSQAREYLKVTFLKPLRDADNELTSKRYSRLSQILEGHDLFKKGADGKESFENYVAAANQQIKEWFENDTAEEGQLSNKKQIKGVIDGFLGSFIQKDTASSFSISGSHIREILEKLSLNLDGTTRPGLGTMNRLYMATELLHLQKPGWNGIKLCLVEEEEAHLHPQAQMKVLETIQKQKGTQFIITTHSPNLASKVELSEDDLNQVVICKDGRAFPMGPTYTLLDKNDYKFLDHFLDVTKANLFFAKGIILVEGWAEEIILPAIAQRMGKDLTAHEVSIVNVGSTAYMRYVKIFMRHNLESMGCKVAIVTDLDVRPNDNDGQFDAVKETQKRTNITEQVDTTDYPDISWYIAERWTLEWCLNESEKFGDVFKEAVSNVHTRTDAFKKENDQFKPEDFKAALIDKLRKYKINEEGKHESVAQLDKVAVAYQFAKLVKEAEIDYEHFDGDSAKYLIDAINHVCS